MIYDIGYHYHLGGRHYDYSQTSSLPFMGDKWLIESDDVQRVGNFTAFALLPVLGWADITVGELRVLIIVAMLATVSMLYHARLRHFLLLPSCLALLGGMAAILMHNGIH